MWMYICQSTDIREINHTFLTSGHSYFPNDADFGVIERIKIKSMKIYGLDHWCELIEKGSNLKVNKMSIAMFKSTDAIKKITTIIKTSEDGHKVEWLKIQWLQIGKDEPLKLYYKYSVQLEVDL